MRLGGESETEEMLAGGGEQTVEGGESVEVGGEAEVGSASQVVVEGSGRVGQEAMVWSGSLQ